MCDTTVPAVAGLQGQLRRGAILAAQNLDPHVGGRLLEQQKQQAEEREKEEDQHERRKWVGGRETENVLNLRGG